MLIRPAMALARYPLALTTASAAQADIAAQAGTAAQADDVAPAADVGDLWDVTTGVAFAIRLHHHAVRALSVHILYCMWTGLGVTGQARAYRTFADADVIASHLN